MEATLYNLQQKISDFIQIVKHINLELNQLNAQLIYYNLFKYSFIFFNCFVTDSINNSACRNMASVV